MITVTAPAKVNLHLEVLGLRPDGFHELAMVMQSIELADRLRFENTADARLSLRCDDASLSVGDDNLILRAAQLLRNRSGFSELGASIYLEKRIPIGAGLAGVVDPDRLEALAATAGFSLQQRPQELAPDTWVALARGLNQGD